jgi:hypothetical protein
VNVDPAEHPELAIREGLHELAKAHHRERDRANLASLIIRRVRGRLVGGGDPQVCIDSALRAVDDFDQAIREIESTDESGAT